MPLRKFFLIAFMWHLCDVRPPSVFLPSAIRKVPDETAFLHHLLLASPVREPHPEGAGRNGLSPPPSRIRYGPTCPRRLSRQPYPGTPSGRCRAKRPFSTTFSNSLWADLPHPVREPHPEGAGRNGLSPPPSRIRYGPTCPRCFSRQPCPGTPSERCRRKCRLPVTFLSGV